MKKHHAKYFSKHREDNQRLTIMMYYENNYIMYMISWDAPLKSNSHHQNHFVCLLQDAEKKDLQFTVRGGWIPIVYVVRSISEVSDVKRDIEMIISSFC